MSRYFNETRKADKWTEALTDKLDIQNLLSPLEAEKDVDEDRTEAPKLNVVRQLIMPVPHDIPLLTRKDESLTQAAESFRTLRTRLLRMQASQNIRSIVFSSALPGEGKTLTTMNLALSCAQIPNLRVLVVDADLRARGLTLLLGSPAGPGLSELLSGDVTRDQAVLATNLPNLCVLPAGATTESPAELFATARWKEFIGWASENFKIVLIDSPPTFPLADFELISAACDGVVFVIRGGSTSREMIRRSSAQVDPRKLLGSVFNMSQDGHGADYRGYTGSALGLKESA
jgi:protein-tyrosine kinase